MESISAHLLPNLPVRLATVSVKTCLNSLRHLKTGEGTEHDDDEVGRHTDRVDKSGQPSTAAAERRRQAVGALARPRANILSDFNALSLAPVSNREISRPAVGPRDRPLATPVARSPTRRAEQPAPLAAGRQLATSTDTRGVAEGGRRQRRKRRTGTAPLSSGDPDLDRERVDDAASSTLSILSLWDLVPF